VGLVFVNDRRHGTRFLIASVAAFVAAALLLPFVGAGPLDVRRLLARQQPDWSILVELRISRTLLGLFVGGALSLAGSLFQAMLRDALATPYTLGVSTGASLGAVVVIALGAHALWGLSAIWMGALAGAATVLVLMVGAALRRGRASAFGLLLAGIATNSVCSAIILVVHGLSSLSRSFSISRWLLGGIDAIGYAPLGLFAAVVISIGLWIVARARDWNLMAVGEEWASARGTPVGRLMISGYVAGSILAASAVTLAGPIGFVELIVPHLVRARAGADHRILMPCSFLLGGVLLAGSDALGRSLLAPMEIPAGAIMAVIGGPYLVWLVRQHLA
jgi:iron complex transport system permease protein